MRIGGEIHFGWLGGLAVEMLLLHPPRKEVATLIAAWRQESTQRQLRVIIAVRDSASGID